MLEDATAITDVMLATGDHQQVPPEMLRALQESGNLPLGAFQTGAWWGTSSGGPDSTPRGSTSIRTCSALPDRQSREWGTR